MIKIITAILNPNINKELKKDKEIEIIAKDIQYEEGIIETLENIKEIDFLIINKKIEKIIKIEELIKSVRKISNKIKIIILLDKEEQIKDNKIKKIYIEKNEKPEEIIRKIKKEIKEKEFIKKEEKNKKIVTIIGTGGAGKSIVCIMIAYFLNKKHKIALLDFDILKQDLHTILGVKKSEQRINKRINLITNIQYFKKNKIENIFKELKEKYEYILIDTSSQINFFPIKNLIKKSEKVILIMEPNLLEIKKANEIIDKFKEKEIKIIINKSNKYSIEENVIKNIFKQNEIIANIKYNDKYHFLINKNFEEINITKEIKKQYQKIINKIEGEE